MTAAEFIKELSEHKNFFKGEIHKEGATESEQLSVMKEGSISGAHPRFLGEYKEYYVKFDFIIDTELLFEVNTPPPHRLLVSPETMVSKLLDKVKLSGEVKIGDKEFDAKYLVQYAPVDKAKKILSEDVKKILRGLEPFVKFEMTNKEYKLLKLVDKLGTKYTPDDAVKDMDKLIEIVELCKKLDS